MSAVNSHVTKHKHETRSWIKTLRKQRGHGTRKSRPSTTRQSEYIHALSDMTRLPHTGVTPMYSQYLGDTYRGKDEKLISDLCSYCMLSGSDH